MTITALREPGIVIRAGYTPPGHPIEEEEPEERPPGQPDPAEESEENA